ncbi:FAHD1 [Symbiodinium pilosum]|uniref:FAHD1 protein n=1 Tax=Symbiodinium pilosum TaxID=2952 RepID=A0A812KLH5_SYMPI|nr:FAHD1 [Symbiodinium pilosum]
MATNFWSTGRKIVAVGKNYQKHIEEMAQIGSKKDEKFLSEGAKTPVLFLKPTSSYLPLGSGPIRLPRNIGPIHHEVELGIVIGQKCKRVKESEALSVIAGYCLALDLTARDLQLAAKEKGMPWSVAKGYDHFTPVGAFVDKMHVLDPHNLELFCQVNGVERQRGNTKDMVFRIPSLISYISSIFTLECGDVILTGTPEGVGPIQAGDKVVAGICDLPEAGLQFDVENEPE